MGINRPDEEEAIGSTDDVEGHRAIKATDDEDVEGHRFAGGHRASDDEDDVEGHATNKR